MAAIQYYDVILKPVITEKSMAGMGEKKYTFLVHPEANKTQIKEAVEKMFEGAKVAKVNTMNQVGKTKRRGMVYGKTAKTKKAIVQLTEDTMRFLLIAVKSSAVAQLSCISLISSQVPESVASSSATFSIWLSEGF